MYLNDSYKKCNPGFGYTSNLNPRRSLTKPSEPAGNDGHDNENSDLIISVNDILVSDDGTSGEYEVRDVLGSGTFGQVVRCRQKGTGKAAAIKVIKNHPAYFHQAHVEIGILHMLNTECDQRDERHIVRMMDHFVHRSHLCICFEVLNINLYELLRQNNFRGLSMSLVRVFLRQLLGSLSVLRGANVIHCDLKPENILIKSLDTGEIKLIDFGSACFQNRTVYQYIQSRFYRAPEVILGIPYGQPIDMWSFGCIVAELYTGLPLFPGENETEQLDCIMEVLGLPPRNMLNVASRRRLFFDSTLTPRMTANSRGRKRRPNTRDLSTALQCADETFLSFLTACLCWEPDDRMTPEEALKHAFIAEALHPPPPSGRNAYAARGAARAAKASPRSPRKRMDPGAAGSTGHGYGRRPYYKETLKHAGHGGGGNFLPSI